MMSEMKRVISRQNHQLDHFKDEIRKLTLTAVSKDTSSHLNQPRFVGSTDMNVDDISMFNHRLNETSILSLPTS